MVIIGGFGRPRYRRYPGGYGGGYGGGGNCLRDLLFLETGCCLAEMLGCGPQLVLLAPALVSQSFGSARRDTTGRASAIAIEAIRHYQREVSAKRRQPCCRYAPSCSVYAIGAFESHGFWRALRLTAHRLWRCRPGNAGGADPVPVAERETIVP